MEFYLFDCFYFAHLLAATECGKGICQVDETHSSNDKQPSDNKQTQTNNKLPCKTFPLNKIDVNVYVFLVQWFREIQWSSLLVGVGVLFQLVCLIQSACLSFSHLSQWKKRSTERNREKKREQRWTLMSRQCPQKDMVKKRCWVQFIQSTKHGWISQLETIWVHSKKPRVPATTINIVLDDNQQNSKPNSTTNTQRGLKQIDKQKAKWILNKFNYMIMNYILSPYFIE